MFELSRLFMLGLQHPLAAPDHLLLLLAGGILAGQQGWRQSVWVNAGFLLTLSFTLWLAHVGYLPLLATLVQPMIPLLLLAGILALLITLRLLIPLWISAILVLTAAVWLGMDLEIPRILGISRARNVEFIWGSVLSNSALFALSTVLALSVRTVLSGLILRVAGAWLAAAALLVLTLQLSQLT